MSPCDPGINPYEELGAEPRSGRAVPNQPSAVPRRLLTAPQALRQQEADARFVDPAWEEWLPWALLRWGYQSGRRAVLAAADIPGLPAARRRQVRFLARTLTDALAPTNFPGSNPAGLRRAVATRGASTLRGIGNMVEDLVQRGGRPAKMPPDSFRIGVDLAATPGQVVHRNGLMELLQYAPQTDTVHEVPLLLLPAWVNKYYIYDLAPGRSLVEWAVRQGYTVFCVSLRDPGEARVESSLDGYFSKGVLPALDAVREITGMPRAHLVGVCAGGLLASALAAWLDGAGEPGAASLTLLMTALALPDGDGDAPSPAGVTRAELTAISWMLARDRHLIDGRRLSLLFDLLRGDATVWEPLVKGWILGERPPAFDLLAWSEDTIDVPRELFQETLGLTADGCLTGGRLRLAGRSVSLYEITADAFVVAGTRDHLAPWDAVYRSAHLLGGRTAFHLVPSGHMGGIVNPPRPTARHLSAGFALPGRSAAWLDTATAKNASWWQSWTEWLAERSGGQVPAREPGSARHVAGQPAPGRNAMCGWPATARSS
ncbi:PHA/PHB synthase family protein [Streptomyces buecherae]|uniref:Alpha/beta fold hydrolase n=1 Tax=Streptomyces buecherae TaxID=2763006 RepID=A0A7H8N6D1_9ACTN|nr:alpha/beta fold hydrolase [Streptomyces buecherae]QKW49923.1 alpha/beta fold hydrolase [Streptomyces buecherae]